MGYREIAAELRAAIERGDYPPGARIPTEHDLTEQYSVSRETVRRALAVLRAAGLLHSATSAGTVVAQPPVRLAVTRYAAVADPDRERSDLGPWETTCREQGIDGRAEVVSVEQIEAPDVVADRLGLEPGETVVHRVRRMWAGKQVAQLQDSWIPAAIAVGTPLADDTKVVGGVYAAMITAGIDLGALTEAVAARVPTVEEQATMALGEAVPVLEVWRHTYDRNNRPVEVLRIVADSRRSMFVFNDLPIRQE